MNKEKITSLLKELTSELGCEVNVDVGPYIRYWKFKAEHLTEEMYKAFTEMLLSLPADDEVTDVVWVDVGTLEIIK